MTLALLNKDEVPNFTEEEIKEVNKYLIKGRGANLSPSTATNFLTLYLEGKTIDEIHRQFPQFDKGMLLLARYKYKWDEERDHYVMDLSKKVRERMIKAKIDSQNFVLDMLSVAHKQFSNEMMEYLQNPVPENLPKNCIKSIHQYREVIKILHDLADLEQKTSGQLPHQQPGVAIQINTSGDGKTDVKISSNQHSEVLKELANETDPIFSKETVNNKTN